MTTMASASVTALPSKRKRAVVSYVQEDDELDRILELDNDSETSDMEFESHKVC